MSTTTVSTAPRPLAAVLDEGVPASLSHVTKRYGATTALDDVSLTIGRGELVAFLGPNGAGKTTAVRLLLGLMPTTSGAARVFGGDPRDAQHRARTGAMLQVARVPEVLTAEEHVRLFSSYYSAPLPLAETLGAAGLQGIEKKRFGELSGGQKQRLLFALAICGDPDLLVLDEPTVGLDVEARRAFWEEIRRFVRRGKSILLTTHYLEEADALADRIVVIDRGRVIAEGTPAQIKSQTSGQRIRCTTRLSLEVVRSIGGVHSAEPDGASIVIRTSHSESVLRELLRRDESISGVEVTSANLEQAFLEMTRR